MDQSEVKEARTILRRVYEHLRQSHIDLGSQDESIGFVDVVHHKTSPLPSLNYVTPRRNTAWISSNHIENGLAALREKGRSVRVQFAEGLYPPIFGSSLRKLGLEVEVETPILVYKAEQKPRKVPNIPKEMTVTEVNDHRSMAIWWYVWRNAHYDVLASTVEPLLIGRDMRSTYLGHQQNLIIYRFGFPIGVIRITMHEGSAHLLAHAIMKEARTDERKALMREIALDSALQKGCDLVFVSEMNETERHHYREMGFVDSGNIVTYAHIDDSEAETATDEAEEQPVLVI